MVSTFDSHVTKFKSQQSKLDDETWVHQMTFDLQKSISTQKRVIIVLDRSGSMRGEPLDGARSGIAQLLKLPNKKISLVTFNSTAQVYHLYQYDNMTSNQMIGEIKAKGGTNFSVALKAIRDILENEAKCDELSILFFTDGQDTRSKEDERNYEIDQLRKCLQQQAGMSDVHCVALGDCDYHFLSSIQFGSRPGTFQRITWNYDIPSSMSLIGQRISVQTIQGYLKDRRNNTKTPVSITKIPGVQNSYQGVAFLSNTERHDFHIVIEGVTFVQRRYIASPADEEMTFDLSVELMAEYASSRVKELTKKALAWYKNSRRKDLMQLREEMKSLQKTVTVMREGALKLKDKHRKRNAMESIGTISEMQSKFDELLAGAMQGKMDNEKILKLSLLSYRKISKRGLLKRIDQRIQNNAFLLNKIDKIVHEAVSKMNFEELKKKYGMMSDMYGTCFMTCCNFMEAMENEDCLCLTMDLRRSQAAIMDPSKVEIKAINSSVITAEAFLDSVVYGMAAHGVRLNETDNSTFVHGGFERSDQGEVIVGQSREVINACLPIFICKEHWKIAKQRQKAIYGYLATTNPLGYSYAQVKTIPFLALSFASRSMMESEFSMKIYNILKTTCQQIYLDASKIIPDSEFLPLDQLVAQQWKEYNQPDKRTVDVIPDNEVFLGYLTCASSVKGRSCNKLVISQDHFSTFYCQILEEEARRCSPLVEPDTRREVIKRFLNIDQAQYVNCHIDYYEKHCEVDESALDLEISSSEIKWDPDGDRPDDWQGRIKFSSLGMKNLTSFQNMVRKRVIKKKLPLTHCLSKMLQVPKMEEVLETDEQMVAMILQNMQGKKNSSRLKYIDKGLYLDPLLETKKLLKRYFTETCVLDIRKGISEIQNAQLMKKLKNVKEAWIKTTNLSHAASLLRGTKIGSVAFREFFKALQNKECSIANHKIRMMLTGRFEGRPLYTDKMKSGGEPMWVASRKNIFRLWKRNKKYYSSPEAAASAFGPYGPRQPRSIAGKKKKLYIIPFSQGGALVYFKMLYKEWRLGLLDANGYVNARRR